MSHASRFKLTDVLASECCHPACYAPAFEGVASPVPLCEEHIYGVYKATNTFLNQRTAQQQEYQLLPAEAFGILGPCPACGICGYLNEYADHEVRCLNNSCRYESAATTFRKTRHDLLVRAADRKSVVYYARFRDCVKIGTTTNLRKRVGNIAAEELLGYELGGVGTESARHRKLATWRVHHEWFELAQPVRTHINKVTSLAAA